MTEQQVEAVASIVAQWYPVVGQLAVLGVKSFHLIREMVKDASAGDEAIDNAVIDALAAKWDDLQARVDLAAEGRTNR